MTETTSNTESADVASPPTGGEAVPAAELHAKAALAADLQDKLLRMAADFDNYKKRAMRERDETRRAASESFITKLLPVIDSFEMAMAAAQQPTARLETLRDGVQMIQNQLRGVVSESGLEEVPAVGRPFDPSIHEAVSQRETDEAPDGHVVQLLRKGYRLRDRLLRPASVVVARPTAGANS